MFYLRCGTSETDKVLWRRLTIPIVGSANSSRYRAPQYWLSRYHTSAGKGH